MSSEQGKCPAKAGGGRGYTRMQVVVVWLHIVVFFALGVLMLH